MLSAVEVASGKRPPSARNTSISKPAMSAPGPPSGGFAANAVTASPATVNEATATSQFARNGNGTPQPPQVPQENTTNAASVPQSTAGAPPGTALTPRSASASESVRVHATVMHSEPLLPLIHRGIFVPPSTQCLKYEPRSRLPPSIGLPSAATGAAVGSAGGAATDAAGALQAAKDSSTPNGASTNNGVHRVLLQVQITREHLCVANKAFKSRHLWGTDTYSLDSDLVCVAHHLGYISLGAQPPEDMLELRVLVIVVHPRPCADRMLRLVSSERHGLRSRSWTQRDSLSHLRVLDVIAIPKASQSTVPPSAVPKSRGAAASGAAQAARGTTTGVGSNAAALNLRLVSVAQTARVIGPVIPSLPLFSSSDASGSGQNASGKAASRGGSRRRGAVVGSDSVSAIPGATVMFSLSNEPCLQYSLLAVADCGLRPQLCTAWRLRVEVLMLENSTERFELSQVGYRTESGVCQRVDSKEGVESENAETEGSTKRRKVDGKADSVAEKGSESERKAVSADGDQMDVVGDSASTGASEGVSRIKGGGRDGAGGDENRSGSEKNGVAPEDEKKLRSGIYRLVRVLNPHVQSFHHIDSGAERETGSSPDATKNGALQHASQIPRSASDPAVELIADDLRWDELHWSDWGVRTRGVLYAVQKYAFVARTTPLDLSQ